MKELKNKNILIGITGSIAAYKVCDIIRILRKEGANVQAIMTESALEFIGKTTIAALTNNPIIDSIFDKNPNPGLEHINLAFKVDLVLVLPATANILSKASNGIADDALSLSLSICEQPTIFFPAMNYKMWRNKAIIGSVKNLRDRNKIVVEPEEGKLASLHEGRGRLPNNSLILNVIREAFNIKLPLKNKKILVTAGPTQEPLDSVRFISNRSSGKMGFAIAESARNLGGEVTLITGPTRLKTLSGIKTINIKTADEMLNEINKKLEVDYLVMNAAVGDYKLNKSYKGKLKKTSEVLKIELVPTIDILKEITPKTSASIIGFALELENKEKNALNKMKEKGLDFIVLNTANNIDKGFDVDTNQVTIFSSSGQKMKSEVDTKIRIADFIWKSITN